MGTRGCGYIGVVVHCIDIGVLEDICLHRVVGWSQHHNTPLASSVAQAFVNGWVARFGIPSVVTTDRGHQFESTLWKELTHLLGCTQLRTTAYHPAANDLVERFHRQLKTSLKVHQNPAHWIDSLPLVLSIRSTLKEELKCNAAELVYGTTLRLPGEFFSAGSVSPCDPSAYVAQLKAAMQALRVTSPRQNQGHKV